MEEMLKHQENNASYAEGVMGRSYANNLLLDGDVRHEEYWKRSIEREIIIIKNSNANLETRMSNISLVAGIGPFLHAGYSVGRAGSSAPPARLGQCRENLVPGITWARFGLPMQ